MKTALLPTTRVAPEFRRELEAVLEKGETLSAFIQASVRRELERREAQRLFLKRGLAAERSAEARNDWLDAGEVVGQVKALAARLTRASPRRGR